MQLKILFVWMSLKSGHRIIPVAGNEQENLVKDFTGYITGTVRLHPDNWFFLSPFIEYADSIYDFKFQQSDVVIMTFPKSGTTWAQEIVWTLLNNPDLNHPEARLPINTRSPFLEFDLFLKGPGSPPLQPGNEIYDDFLCKHPGKDPQRGIYLQIAEAAGAPRVIKTHLSFDLLHPDLLNTCKVIYVMREPKDIAISYYHHSKIFKSLRNDATLDAFINCFLNDQLNYSPMWKHVKAGWDKRHHPNLHFCFYEDLKEDPQSGIMKLQHFLGTNLTEIQIDNVVKYTSFDAMKSRDNVFGFLMKPKDREELSLMDYETIQKDGGFFRKGIAGEWKSKLTKEQILRIDEWTSRNTQDFGPEFRYGK